MTSAHGVNRDLVAALKSQSTRAGAQAPSVRGADWRTATVTAVGAGTVTADGIVARCMERYALPAIGDVAVISQSSNGNWIALGRLASAASTWANLTLASGYINPGHGYTASWMRDGSRLYLRGRIGLTGGGGMPNATTIATIPTGIRPAGGAAVGWAAVRDNGLYPSVTRVEITDTGVLRTYDSSTPLPTWIALDGITYTI